jgi:hypothetical protein
MKVLGYLKKEELGREDVEEIHATLSQSGLPTLAPLPGAIKILLEE